MNIHNWTEAVITYFGCFKEKPNVRSFEVSSSLCSLLAPTSTSTNWAVYKQSWKQAKGKKEIKTEPECSTPNIAYTSQAAVAQLWLKIRCEFKYIFNSSEILIIFEICLILFNIQLMTLSLFQLNIKGYLIVGAMHNSSPAYFCWVATECLSVKAIWWIKLVIADGCLSLT